METDTPKIQITPEAFFKEAKAGMATPETCPVVFANDAEFVERKFLEPALKVATLVNGRTVDLVLTPGGMFKAYLHLE